MKYKIRSTGKTIELGKDQFKAKGGEGSIYILDQTVYKVCDPGKMIADGKFVELNKLTHSRIIKPEDVLLDSKNKPVGYTMRLVPGNSFPLAQMLTKTYREREGVTPDIMGELVQQIYDGVKNGIHGHPGYLQVDGNQLNYMVTNAYKDLFFIDVNSYQTPNFPADAIMPNIRDWQAGNNFTQLTDWYTFSIIAWYMFTGIHPFMHSHPRFTNRKTSMVDQMTAGVSILDKESTFPKAAVYYPFEDVIPGGKDGSYMQWFRAIFLENKRVAPPASFQAILAAITTVIKVVTGSNNFDITELRQFLGQITGFVEHNGRDIVVTTDSLYVDNQSRDKIDGKFRVGFTPKLNTPVALIMENDKAKIKNLDTGTWLPNNAAPYEVIADDIMSCEGRLYVHFGQNISEIIFPEAFALLPMSKNVASVLPHATQLFQGLAIQNMMGSCIASIFPESGHHRQIRLDEITESMRIVEAKYERNVLMVVVIDGEIGDHTRFVFRFKPQFSGYDVRRIDGITPTGINFTVMENGVVVCINEEEKVEIFSNKASDQNMKLIEDPAIKANMRLFHKGTQVRFAHGDKMYSFAVKKVKP